MLCHYYSSKALEDLKTPQVFKLEFTSKGRNVMPLLPMGWGIIKNQVTYLILLEIR